MAAGYQNSPFVFETVAGVPRRDIFPPIVNDQLADFYNISDAVEIETFRKNEIEALAGKIRALPILPFNEAREREMLRLTQYYEAFATLFGIDLREVARTRTQLNATVMYTSPILLQAMFDDTGREDRQGLTFFEGRIQAGGFSFNATSINIIEGYPMSFSVLKRILRDASGEYEIDYPAVSLPREALRHLKNWHQAAYPAIPFGDNPILTYIADAFSYRIHDWIHQAILYDTNSATQIFQKWSDDSYFVEHFFHDPAMINYEFMSDKIHYLVWQQLLAEHTEVQKIMLSNASVFLGQLNTFEEWQKINGEPTPEKPTNFLGYVGLRGLFNILPIHSLKTALGHNPRFATLHTLLPEKYRGYLAKLYEPVDELWIPFRKGKSTRISLQQILEEYVAGLREEFQTQKILSTTGALWQLGAQDKLKNLLTALPPTLLQQMDERSDLRLLDPRVLLLLEDLIQRLTAISEKNTFEALLARLEIDPSGYFYLMIDQDEVDMAISTTVPYQKAAILIQLPWGYEGPLRVTLTRSQNVVAEQIGASDQVLPGGILLINIENERLAKELLGNLATPNSKPAFTAFWQKMNAERARGHIALGDAYPYQWDKVQAVFNIPQGNIFVGDENRPTLQAGYYETKPAERRVVRVPGPISMNSGRGDVRRRILAGGLAENHILSETLDIFPVDAISFDKFYQADRLALPILQFSTNFGKRTGFHSLKQANHAAQIIFETLALINDAIIHGFRGKPHKVRIKSLLSES